MSVSIEGLVRAAQAELAGLDTKLRRRQHVVIRKVLAQQGEDLRVQEKGKWGAATRQRLLLFLGHGARTMAAAQSVDLGAGLFNVVGASQGHAARWLATLDQHYLGELRPYAWTSKAWAIATGQEHLETRLRAFHGSFLRYGSLVVGDVERALGKLALGASWDEVRALVAKATAEQTAGKSWMVERIVRTEAAHAYSAAAWRAMLEEDTPGSPMLKKLVAVHDLVTGKDSMLLDGQIRPVREPFFDEWNGRHYMHPPNRPNDREIVVPWRASYGDHRKARGKRARRMMPEAKPTRVPVEDRKRQIVEGFDAVKAAQRTLAETVGVAVPARLPRAPTVLPVSAAPRGRRPSAKTAKRPAATKPTPQGEASARLRKEIATFERQREQALVQTAERLGPEAKRDLGDLAARQRAVTKGRRGVTPTGDVVTAPQASARQMDRWIGGLTSEQREAMKSWSDEGWFQRMRAIDSGRGAEVVTDGDAKIALEAERKMTAMREALATAPRYEGEMSRGVRDLPKGSALRKVLSTKGAVVEMESVSSWSPDERTARSFADDSPGSFLLRVVTKRGAVVGDERVSYTAREAEIMLDRGARFRVVETKKRKGDDHRRLVILEEIDPA